MARYVGAAVMTAIVAALYSSASSTRAAAGDEVDASLAAGFATSSLVLAALSASGIAVALLAARHRPVGPSAIDAAAAAASSLHTIAMPDIDNPLQPRSIASARGGEV